MSRNFAVIGFLGCTVVAVAGCWRHSSTGPASATYRTISAEPWRDTQAARADNDVGLNLLANGDVKRAEEAFKQALVSDDEFGPAHNNLGKVYFRQKEYHKAAWEFDYACELLPKRAEPRNNLGLVWEQAGELDRAVEEYREAINLEPENVEYRANLARALVRRGDRTEEVVDLLHVVLRKDARPEWRLWAFRQQASPPAGFR